ncbi:MAG: hypothetical protein HOV97_31885, partial [Nonomuraea sp.]|nr:hypothetical protein [Nonomuraea sp.]
LAAWSRPLREAEHLRGRRRWALLLGPPGGLALFLAAALLVALGAGGLWTQLLCLPLLGQLLVEVAARRAPARQITVPIAVASGGPTVTRVP